MTQFTIDCGSRVTLVIHSVEALCAKRDTTFFGGLSVISMYDVSVPVFSERLRALALVLTKAEANATERKIDQQVFLNARLAPDMLNLTKQVQIATDHAKGASSRLAGREIPRYEDNEASFAELQARIAKTRDYLATFTSAEFDGSEERVVTLKIAGNDVELKGKKYLLDVAMPNFYFHITTAYAIMRHNGVPLGKGNFLGRE